MCIFYLVKSIFFVFLGFKVLRFMMLLVFFLVYGIDIFFFSFVIFGFNVIFGFIIDIFIVLWVIFFFVYVEVLFNYQGYCSI